MLHWSRKHGNETWLPPTFVIIGLLPICCDWFRQLQSVLPSEFLRRPPGKREHRSSLAFRLAFSPHPMNPFQRRRLPRLIFLQNPAGGLQPVFRARIAHIPLPLTTL